MAAISMAVTLISWKFPGRVPNALVHFDAALNTRRIFSEPKNSEMKRLQFLNGTRFCYFLVAVTSHIYCTTSLTTPVTHCKNKWQTVLVWLKLAASSRSRPRQQANKLKSDFTGVDCLSLNICLLELFHWVRALRFAFCILKEQFAFSVEYSRTQHGTRKWCVAMENCRSYLTLSAATFVQLPCYSQLCRSCLHFLWRGAMALFGKMRTTMSPAIATKISCLSSFTSATKYNPLKLYDISLRRSLPVWRSSLCL